MSDDDHLLGRAEQALTEIKVNQGLSEEHEAVLAALRIRLTGTGSSSLEEMLAAASDDRSASLEETIAQTERAAKKPSLDDLFAEQPKPPPDWPA
jgi:flagellar hook-length control protein FliK